MQHVPQLESARIAAAILHPGTPFGRTDAECDRRFVGMLRSLRETGGLMRGDELADLMVQKESGDVSRLARWIVTREVIGFDWRGELWVPMFQFNLATMTLRPEAGQVAAELAAAFDPWALSLWFATPNVWLGERTPADALGVDTLAVLDAARADRFAVMG